jgi:hypothetical protein
LQLLRRQQHGREKPVLRHFQWEERKNIG